jgi:hypothetical protein
LLSDRIAGAFSLLNRLLRIAEQSAGPIRVDQDDLPAILKARSKKSPCAQGRVACQNSQMIKSAPAYIA